MEAAGAGAGRVPLVDRGQLLEHQVAATVFLKCTLDAASGAGHIFLQENCALGGTVKKISAWSL